MSIQFGKHTRRVKSKSKVGADTRTLLSCRKHDKDRKIKNEGILRIFKLLGYLVVHHKLTKLRGEWYESPVGTDTTYQYPYFMFYIWFQAPEHFAKLPADFVVL